MFVNAFLSFDSIQKGYVVGLAIYNGLQCPKISKSKNYSSNDKIGKLNWKKGCNQFSEL